MRKFEWRNLKHEGTSRISLMEVRKGGRLFWASLEPDEESIYYHPIVLNRLRSAYMHIMETLSLKDAKSAVEKELFNEGVIEDGDIMEDYTE
jgi:hypothetical protein